jgi:hypothetical protein
MPDARRGSALVVKSQEELEVVQQLAAQDLQGYGAVAEGDLLRQEDCSHAARAQFLDDPVPPREAAGQLCLGHTSGSREWRPVVQTEASIVRIGPLALGTGAHVRWLKGSGEAPSRRRKSALGRRVPRPYGKACETWVCYNLSCARAREPLLGSTRGPRGIAAKS